jgi:hypothetical protein
MAIKDYSATPANNGTISGINIAEGCQPSGINDAIRQQMADLKAADWGTGTPKTDAIAESTAGAGVTIDGLLIKDGAIPGLGATLKVSSDDTTAGYLDGKLALASNSGLVLAVTSPAGNEVLTVGVDLDTNPGLVLGAGGLKVDLGVTVQAYDADTLFADVHDVRTKSHPCTKSAVTDNSLTPDLTTAETFDWTPTGAATLNAPTIVGSGVWAVRYNYTSGPTLPKVTYDGSAWVATGDILLIIGFGAADYELIWLNKA